MRPQVAFRASLIALSIAVSSIAPAIAQHPEDARAGAHRDLMIGTDMGRPVLYLLNMQTDRMITLDLTRDPNWPGGTPLHTLITPDGQKGYLSIIGTEDVPPMILALRIGEIDWNAGRADVTIGKVLRIQEAGLAPAMRVPDAVEGTARMIIGPAATPEDAGIYKAASDIMVVGNKLYVAEEDSMDEEIDGSFISIWDLSDRAHPKFIRRLAPGDGLPDEWRLSHEFYRTEDGRFLFAQDWDGAYLVKLDPRTDEVIRVWSKEDGFQMPHGNFVVGALR